MTKSTITVEQGKFEQIPHWILFDTNISATALRLYLVLQKYGNAEHRCYPSRQRLADNLGVSKATVDRAKTELIEVGALCETRRMGTNNNYTSNIYHLHWVKNLTCKTVITSDEGWSAGDEGWSAGDEYPSPTSDELTNTHIELIPTEQHITSAVAVATPEQAKQLAQQFCDTLRTNGIHSAKVTPKWIGEIDKMHRLDGRTWEQIESCIRWATTDAFWCGVILSPTKLRKHYDQMNIQARKQNTTPQNIYGQLAQMYEAQEQTNELG